MSSDLKETKTRFELNFFKEDGWIWRVKSLYKDEYDTVELKYQQRYFIFKKSFKTMYIYHQIDL